MTSTVTAAKTASLWASLANYAEKKWQKTLNNTWGFLPDWKKEPSCGCTRVCVINQRIKIEQPPDPARAKAPRRR
jgi:hypothetical protein